ncbi:glycosyltransferase [Rossellomorea aquimaris]|uniref:glycosyltransferase n=1 Tax=Rossellomorea aquimaris TaxID=189382 RepID=UPI0007D066BE|nr:glycosyltransferase [Rossellomorea aquimaris]
MKKVLIASFDLEVGGVERSLISMLENFDYVRHDVDLMLYSHTGDFMNLLPNKPNLLPEVAEYKTFRMPISKLLKEGKLPFGLTRLLAKYKANFQHSSENGYKQMQYMWKYSVPLLPKMKKQYDVAISYLWPHYFVAKKVEAKTKIAWIHTDFSTVDTDVKVDVEMWNEFNYIIAVSEQCKKTFLLKYPSLSDKVLVIENITAPDVVKTLSVAEIDNPMDKDNRFKVISVARLSHAKGIDMAVKAMKILKDKGFNNIVWYIVGYGGEESNLRILIKENNLEDSFILLGKKVNPYPYMKSADLYVQPSRYEGKAVTVGEAQILNKPVLITNYPTATSQVENGINGVICKLSSSGLADGIENLYKNHQLREALEKNCKLINYNNTFELNKLYELVYEKRY